MRREDKTLAFYFKKIIMLLVIVIVFIVVYIFFVENIISSIQLLISEQVDLSSNFPYNEFGEGIKILALKLSLASIAFVFGVNFLINKFYDKNNVYVSTLANTVMYKLKTVLIEINKDGNIIGYNPYAQKLFDLQPQQNVADKSFYDIIFEDDKKVAMSMIKKYSGGITSVNYTLRGVSESGSKMHILWSFCGSDDDENITLLGSNQTDNVIFEKRLLLSEERYFRSAQAANDIFFELEIKSNTLIMGDKYKELTGHSKLEYDMDEFLDCYVWDDDKDDVRSFFSNIQRGDKQVFELEHRVLKSDGTCLWVRVGAALLHPAGYDDDDAYVVGTITDINENKLRDLKIRQLAYYDILTQLPNRLSFMEVVSKSLKENEKAAMFYIDIDNFKFVNDNFGHNKGDELLVTIAKTLSKAVSDKDIVARLGGDEFGMFFKNIKTEEQAVSKAQEIFDLFESMVKDTPLYSRISPSLGIVICPTGGKDYDEVINNADIAMYAAKRVGKRCYKIFEPSMKREIIELSEMESHLSNAIQNNELYLVYQPMYSNSSKKVVGFESLLRWNSPTYGTVMPGRIVPIAEQGALMYSIGYWVIKTAAEYSKKLTEMGSGDLEVSLNISVKQFMRDDFVGNVKRIISDAGADPSKIVFELDQKSMFDNYDILERKMLELSAFGIKFSLDDVSSHLRKLVHLMQLPFSSIKLDVKISHPNLFDISDTSLIEPIVSLAKEHDVSIVVESVEDKDLIDKIYISYADRLQGYALSRPISEESTYQILRADSNDPTCDSGSL